MICIYKITNPNGDIYIGQTRDFNRRLASYRSNNTPNQIYLHRSIKKYGWNSHAVTIEKSFFGEVSQGDLNLYEIEAIEKYRLLGVQLMNIRGGGSNGPHSEETKKKIGASNKGKLVGRKLSDIRVSRMRELMIGNKYRLGKKTSEKQKRIVSEYAKQKVFTDKIRLNMSLAKIGAKNPMFGKKLTQEHKDKISKSLKSRTHERA